MRRSRIFLSLVIAALLLVAVSPGTAQTPYYPVGSVSIDMTSVAAGVGFSSGSGVLRFNGKRHLFKIDGLSVGNVGIAQISAVGNVYNMTSLSQFAGNYAAVGAGIALAGGAAGRAAAVRIDAAHGGRRRRRCRTGIRTAAGSAA